ncbi:MAG: acyl-CoA/acyl-ACP dehydrogenase [SAR324 cluster bacterium]|nr:acyl-CoA/acyl-ACP dehydrogenase [SAR324 cluster bacterium]
MLSKPDRRFPQEEPIFEDISFSLEAISRQPAGMQKEIRNAVLLARKFKNEFLKPQTLEMDRRIQQNPSYLPWEWIEAAHKQGFFSLWIPKLFGGKGYCFPSLAYFLEELSSECLGMANLIGVHYLGLGTLIVTWNLAVIQRVCEEVRQSEKTGKPCLISLAITEPSSGTDTTEADLVDRGRIGCHAKKTEGGYLLNGSKIFISNGPFSTWHIVLAFEDLKRPSESSIFLAVKAGTPGFSVGSKEKKMGQMACPASEILFNDCFIPDDQVCLSPAQTQGFSKSHREIFQYLFDQLTSISRVGICAFGTGAARGAYEATLKFVSETQLHGSYLINQEWVQSKLAEMYKNITISRLLYAETNYGNGLYGVYKMLQFKPVYYAMKFCPEELLQWGGGILSKHPRSTRLIRKMEMEHFKPEHIQRTAGIAALAKFAGADAGIENCRIAMEIMGQAGLRHANGIEKRLRDSKLLQIYEGTNQLNRFDLFRHLIGRSYSHVRMYEESERRNQDA